MSEPSQLDIQTDDSYEEIACEYQYEMVKTLRAALKKHGISEEKQKEICQDFTFDFGMIHDQGDIRLAGSHKKNGKSFQPVIGFIDDNNLHMTSEFFSWHEYAFGNVDEAFAAPVSKLSKLANLVRKKKD